jgi:hypothetical protein
VSDFAAVAEEWDQVDVAAFVREAAATRVGGGRGLRLRVERLQARLNGR